MKLLLGFQIWTVMLSSDQLPFLFFKTIAFPHKHVIMSRYFQIVLYGVSQEK